MKMKKLIALLIIILGLQGLAKAQESPFAVGFSVNPTNSFRSLSKAQKQQRAIKLPV
jgi:hypothetical protein